MADFQRSFYETGYARREYDYSTVLVEVASLSEGTRIRRVAHLLHGCSGAMLDVGCGNGSLLYWVRSHFSRLVGIDIAEAQLSQARAWAQAMGVSLELHTYNTDTDEIPIEQGSIDACACVVVLEFVMSPERIVAQIARALRIDGTLVVTVGNIVSWKNRMRVILGQDPRTTVFRGAINGGALHHFTRSTICRLLKDHGFMIDYVGCSGRWWQMRQIWPSLLGGDIVVRARKTSSG
jgi:SAM-dependent methyltransferase